MSDHVQDALAVLDQEGIDKALLACWSLGVNIGFELAPDGKRLLIVSCLDNLLKGASSQAVQNMNLMFGWKEEEGLL